MIGACGSYNLGGSATPNWGLIVDQDPSNACALDFGSFVDPSSVGPVAELLGPRWAKEKKSS